MKRPVSRETIRRRDKLIVKAILQHRRTATIIGQSLGLSRERIAQIFYRETGKSVKQVRLEMKMKEYERVIGEGKKFCKVCGARIKEVRRRKYCSMICNQRAGGKRKLAKSYKCTYCGKRYHASQPSLYAKSKNRFCSHEHYLLWKRKNASLWGKKSPKVKRVALSQKKILEEIS